MTRSPFKLNSINFMANSPAGGGDNWKGNVEINACYKVTRQIYGNFTG